MAPILVADVTLPSTSALRGGRVFGERDLDEMADEVLAMLAAVWAEAKDPSLRHGWSPFVATSREGT